MPEGYGGREEPRRVGLRRGEYPGRRYRTVKEKALSRMDGDIKEIMKSLTNVNDRMSFYRLASYHVSKVLINICYEILDRAVARTPYRTGQLRDSGKVVLYSGRKQTENIALDVRADGTGRYEIRRWIDGIRRPAALLSAEISFERVDRGKDVALWAHEDLGYYEERPRSATARAVREEAQGRKEWWATKPGAYGVGTGPKYLEGPYNELVGTLRGRLEAALSMAVQEYNKKTGQRVRRRR